MSYDKAKDSNIKEEELLLVPEKYQELPFEELRRQLINKGVIDVFWMRSDVEDCARGIGSEIDIVLTEDEVDWVVEKLIHYHDANYGINWDIIEDWVHDVLELRSKKVQT